MEAHIRITWVLILYFYANTYMSTHASLTKKGVFFVVVSRYVDLFILFRKINI